MGFGSDNRQGDGAQNRKNAPHHLANGARGRPAMTLVLHRQFSEEVRR